MSQSLKYAVCGAVLAASLVACDAGPAAAENGSVPKVRAQLDAARNRVWLLTADGLAVYEPAVPGRVLRVPLLGWQISEKPAGCVPEFALGPKGEAVVASDLVPVLLRVDPETLKVTRHELRLDDGTGSDRDSGVTVLRYLPARGAYLAVSRQDGSIWRIDRDLRTAHRLGRQALPQQNDCGARAGALVRQLRALDE